MTSLLRGALILGWVFGVSLAQAHDTAVSVPVASSIANDGRPGVYEVRSFFNDEELGPHDVAGSGFVFSTDGQAPYFLMTVAHVGAGRAASFQFRGKAVRLTGEFLIDSRTDLAVFQIDESLIKNGLVPLGRWDRAREKVFVDPTVVMKWPHFLPQALKGDWVTTPAAFDLAAIGRSLSIHLVSVELSSGGSLLPGMSGTPLIGRSFEPVPSRAESETMVLGVAMEFDRYFRSSYFASYLQVIDLMRAFGRGERHEKSAATWRYRGGFSYRTLRPQISETSFRNPAGSGVRATSGDYARAASGSSVRATSGSSVRAASGNGSRADGGASEAALVPGVLFGIEEAGRPVIGWRLHTSFVYADNTGLFVRDGVDLRTVPILQGEDMPYLLAQRYVNLLPVSGRVTEAWESARELNFTTPSNARSRSDVSTMRINEDHISLHLHDRTLGSDIDVTLNEFGAEASDQPETPLREYKAVFVKRVNGVSYVVDTRPLFFMNLDSMNLPVDPQEQFRKKFEDRRLRSLVSVEKILAACDQYPAIRVRRLDSDHVVTFTFDTISSH